MTSPVAWINGEILPFARAAVPVWDLGVVAGASVTEMARTFAHRPFRLDQHVDRLCSSLAALGFPQPWMKSQLIDAAEDIVRRNVASLKSTQDLGIVLFSTAGSNATYLDGDSSQTTTCIHSYVLPFGLWKSGVSQGVRLVTPSIRQIPGDCFSVEHKVRNRLHWWLADREAAATDPGAKALLLDQNDFVTETSTSCFFTVIDGRIVTTYRSVLNSLSGRLVEELAGRCGISFERRAFKLSELTSASEAFLSSTPSGLMAVSHINGRSLQTPINGHLCAGPVMRRLLEEYQAVTGLRPDLQIIKG